MKTFLGVCLALALTGTAWAQTREELARDLVVNRDGKLLFDDYSLCRLDARKLLAAARIGGAAPQDPPREAITFQIHMTAEAKADGWISRDNFVAYIAAASTYIQIGVFLTVPNLDVSKALSALKCKTVEEPIGTPDIEVKLFMTRDGLQIETTNTANGQTTRQTTEWEP